MYPGCEWTIEHIENAQMALNSSGFPISFAVLISYFFNMLSNLLWSHFSFLKNWFSQTMAPFLVILFLTIVSIS